MQLFELHQPRLPQSLPRPRLLRCRSHAHHGRERAGQDEPARGRRAPVRAAFLPRRDRRRHGARRRALRDRGNRRGAQRRGADRRDLVARRGPRVLPRRQEPRASGRSPQLAPAVFLAPEHRELVAGAPTARRRFLDRLVARPEAGRGRRSGALRGGPARAQCPARAARQSGAGAARASSTPGPRSSPWRARPCGGTAIAALAAWEAEFRAARARSRRRLTPGSRSPTRAAATRPTTCARPANGSRRSSGAAATRSPGPHRDDLVWSRRGRALGDRGLVGRDRAHGGAGEARRVEGRREGGGRAAALRRRRFRRGPLGGLGRGVLRSPAAQMRPCC